MVVCHGRRDIAGSGGVAVAEEPLGCVAVCLLLLATLVWSLWEVGLDAWGLLPRLGLLVAGGLWLLTPLGSGALHSVPGPLLGPRARAAVWIAIAVAMFALIGALLAPRRAPSANRGSVASHCGRGGE